MGLFDSLKKMAEDIGKNVNMNDIKDGLDKMGLDLNNDDPFGGTTQDRKEKKSTKIDEEYCDFPLFPLEPKKIRYTKTRKYHRCSMDFNEYDQRDIDDYKYKITTMGYIQSSKVRFDKENTYIIVDPDANCGLNVVFHIKR